MLDRLFSAPGVWSLRRCRAPNCRLTWLDPQPEVMDIPKLYTGYYTAKLGVETSYLRWWVKRAVLGAALGYTNREPVFRRMMGRLLGLIPVVREMAAATVMYLPATDRGRVLDLGCGNGYLLRNLARLGWTVFGLDPDPAAISAANELLGPVGRVGEIGTVSFDRDFDVITMNHVIEHLPDPITTLRHCLSKLRSGGRIVVQTPNADSWGARRFGSAWVHWDPPRHLYLFSPTTLQRAAEEAGFIVDEVRTSVHGARFAWAVSRAIQRHGKLDGTRLWDRRGTIDNVPSSIFQFLESFRRQGSGEEVVLLAHRS
jgi:SAM-dependent methyltransferase